jgi:hypothetical protein
MTRDNLQIGATLIYAIATFLVNLSITDDPMFRTRTSFELWVAFSIPYLILMVAITRFVQPTSEERASLHSPASERRRKVDAIALLVWTGCVTFILVFAVRQGDHQVAWFSATSIGLGLVILLVLGGNVWADRRRGIERK